MISVLAAQHDDDDDHHHLKNTIDIEHIVLKTINRLQMNRIFTLSEPQTVDTLLTK